MNLHGALMTVKEYGICSDPAFCDAVKADIEARLNRWNSSIFPMLNDVYSEMNDDYWENRYLTCSDVNSPTGALMENDDIIIMRPDPHSGMKQLIDGSWYYPKPK